jgi:hypothetical protein
LGEYRASLRGETLSPTTANEGNDTHSEQYLTPSGEADWATEQRSHPSHHKSESISSNADIKISAEDFAVKNGLTYDPCTQDHTVGKQKIPFLPSKETNVSSPYFI